MSLKKYRLLTIVFVIIVAGLTYLGVEKGNAWIPATAYFTGAAALYLLRRRLKVILADERVYRISGLASRLTMVIAIMAMALAGVILIALSTDGRAYLETAGMTLGFSICAMLLLYVILYHYFSHKLGG